MQGYSQGPRRDVSWCPAPYAWSVPAQLPLTGENQLPPGWAPAEAAVLQMSKNKLPDEGSEYEGVPPTTVSNRPHFVRIALF